MMLRSNYAEAASELSDRLGVPYIWGIGCSKLCFEKHNENIDQYKSNENN